MSPSPNPNWANPTICNGAANEASLVATLVHVADRAVKALQSPDLARGSHVQNAH